MVQHLRVCLFLLVSTLLLCSVIYPLILWGIGQTIFPDQAEGSLVDEDGNPVTNVDKARGSRLIAQPFKGEEYFQPRPSNAGNGYDASASGASNWGASNPLLRSRVARQLGPIVKYADDPRNKSRQRGRPVARDIEAWFQNQKPDFVARWAGDNSTVAEQWVKDNSGVVADFLKKKVEDVKSNSGDATQDFWKGYAKAFPSTWPTVEDKTVDRKTVKVLVPAREGPDVQAFFFDLWLQDNPKVILERVPADMVMSSGSGLDPHITLKNALYQLRNRVAEKQTQKILEDDPALAQLIADAKQQPNPGTRKPIEAEIKKRKARLRNTIEAKIGQPLEKRITEVIEHLLHEKKEVPLGGLAGVDLVNVLELNLALNARMKQLQTELH